MMCVSNMLYDVSTMDFANVQNAVPLPQHFKNAEGVLFL